MINSTHIWIGVAALLVCALGEALHSRRIARASRLAFPATGSPRAWTWAVPILRPICCGVLAWSLLTIIARDGQASDGVLKTKDMLKPATRHLVIAMDVSPSMSQINDAGPQGKQSRRDRARDVITSAISRIDLAKTRVSLVAFWNDAKPVVVDTFDMNIIANAVADLPLGFAFAGGKTDLAAGIRGAAELARAWPPNSTTLLVISDGGDPGNRGMLATLPPSIGDVLVVGVGDPYKSTAVDETYSRQERESLDQTAARVRGVYFDANQKHLPSGVLSSLRMLGLAESETLPLRTIALIGLGVSSGFLILFGPLLAIFGCRHAPMPMKSVMSDRTSAPRPGLKGTFEVKDGAIGVGGVDRGVR